MIIPIPHSLLVQACSRLTIAGVASLWQGAALACMAGALLLLMPRASASLRHRLLVAIFFVTAILPWISFGGGTGTTSAGHAVRIAPWLAAWVAFAWISIACFRARNLMHAWQELRAVHKAAVPIELDGIAAFRAGKRSALLCVSSHVDSPTVIGLLHPRILLPDWMVPLLAQDDLRQIALHECEHLRRYDDWLNLMLQVGLVLSPLNPALIWIDRRIEMQRELACDAAVVAVTCQPIAYATCLTRLAEQRRHHTRLVLALAAWGTESRLGQRVQALLAPSTSWTGRQLQIATCASVALLCVAAVGFARAPQLIQVGLAPLAPSMSAGLIRIDSTGYGGVRFDDRIPSYVQALPVSFRVRSESTRASAKQVGERQLPQHRSMAVALKNRQAPVHTVRIAAVETARMRSQRGALRRMHVHAPVRFVTAEFSSPYVAVPVRNGWLIIQL